MILTPTLYGALGAGLVIVVLGVAVKVQTARLDAAVAKYKTFVAEVATLGKAQEAAAKVKDAQNKARQDKANAENARTRKALTIALNGLRDSSARGGGLSVPTPATASVEGTACFDSTKLDSALRKLDSRVLEIVTRGSQAEVDLDSAKAWAAGS